jgi:hypothetical protein
VCGQGDTKHLETCKGCRSTDGDIQEIARCVENYSRNLWKTREKFCSGHGQGGRMKARRREISRFARNDGWVEGGMKNKEKRATWV